MFFFYDWILASDWTTVTPTTTGTFAEITGEEATNTLHNRCSFQERWRGDVDLTLTLEGPPNEAEAVVVAGVDLVGPADSIELFRQAAPAGPFVSQGTLSYESRTKLWSIIPPTTGAAPNAYRLVFTDGAATGQQRTSFIGFAQNVVEIRDEHRPSRDWRPNTLDSVDARAPAARHGLKQPLRYGLSFPLRFLSWRRTEIMEFRIMMLEAGYGEPILVVLDEDNLDREGDVLLGCIPSFNILAGSPGEFAEVQFSVTQISDEDIVT